MRVFDLTQTIRENMPVFPGTLHPKLTDANDYATDGFRETLLHMTSHTGTHMDAPYHIFPDREPLDALEVSAFVGAACVIDATVLPPDGEITMDCIEARKADVEKCDFVLFRTGWDKYWDEQTYFGDYPVISLEVARYMAENNKKGLAFDTIGIDPVKEMTLPRHQIILGAGMVIVENLCNLGGIDTPVFTFAALPLRFENADGSPVRAIAICD